MLVLGLLAAIVGTFIYGITTDPSPIMQVVCGLIVLGSIVGLAAKFRHDPNTQVARMAPLATTIIGLVLIMALELIIAPSNITTIVVGFGLPLVTLVGFAIFYVANMKKADPNYVNVYSPIPVRVRHR